MAEKIFNCTTKKTDFGFGCFCSDDVFVEHGDSYPLAQRAIKPYSTSIEAAWEIVEKLKTEVASISVSHNSTDTDDWFCHIFVRDTTYNVLADTAPLAICLAALKCKGVVG